MWLTIIFMEVDYTSNVQIFFYQEFLQLFLSFSQHCDSFLPLLFQLFHGGLFWKCILTKVSYAILTQFFVIKVTLLKMQTLWLGGTLQSANFHSHYFSDTYFGLHYPWPQLFEILNFSLSLCYFLTLAHCSSDPIYFTLIKSFQSLTLCKNLFISTFYFHHHFPQCS